MNFSTFVALILRPFSVLPQHINALEEAAETCSSILFSSWDIKRAFDSVAKPLLTLAWQRLGVPPDIAQLLVSYDTNGRTIVGTPLARDTLRRRGTKAFSLHPSPTNLWCFDAVVGTGQGDIPSPCNWNAFFDILLTALSSASTQPFSTRSQDHLIRTTQDTAYADDLLSISATTVGLQAKADIVSAFCIIFGMDIAASKLRAVQIHWGQEDRHCDASSSLLIRNHSWPNTTSVPLRSWNDPEAKPTKYLGILFDFINSHSTHLHLTSEGIRRDFSTLHRRACLPLLKIEVAIAGVISKARYAAVHSSWNLPTLRKIDRIFSTHYRKILSLHAGFPHALLYAPAQVAGIGLPRFSDLVVTSKLSLIHRALRGDAATSHAMEGLLSRAARYADSPLCPGRFSPLLPPTPGAPSTWSSSVVAWLAQASLSLATGGIPAIHTWDETLASYFSRAEHPLPPTVLSSFHASSLHHIDDILTFSPHGVQWLTIPSVPSLLLDFSLPPIPPPTHLPPSLSLRPFQCWLLRDQDRVVELLGRATHSPTQLYVRYWLPPRPLLATPPTRLTRHTPAAYQIGQFLHLDPLTHSRGAATDILLDEADIMQAIHPALTRIILSGDLPRPRGLGVQRQILYVVVYTAPPRPFPSPDLPSRPFSLPHPLRLLPQHFDSMRDMRIFTDGSYSRTTAGLHGLYSSSASSACASIIFQPTNDRLLGPRTVAIRITGGESIQGCNAYIMESLALTLACFIRRTVQRSHAHALLPIYTDCKSARHHALHPPSNPWTTTAYFLFQLLWTLHPSESDLFWTPSHPERRTRDFSKWTDLECGNQIADLFASPSPPLTPGHQFTITAGEVLQFLQLHSSWHIADGPLPLLTSPLKLIQQTNHQDYLSNRDSARRARGKPDHWASLNLSRTGLWSNSVQASYTLRARITKLTYDWYIHGAKRTLSSKERYPSPDPCPLCGDEDTRYHMLCGCPHISVSAIRNQTIISLSAYISTLAPHSHAHTCTTAYRSLLLPESSLDPHLLWAGTLTSRHLQFLTTHTPPIMEVIHPSHPTYVALRKASGMVLRGSLDMLAARHAAITRQAYHRRRLYRRAEGGPVYRRNSYRPPPRAKHHPPPSLASCLRITPRSLSTTLATPVPRPSSPPPTPPITSLPRPVAPSPRFRSHSSPRPSPTHLTQLSLDSFLNSLPSAAPLSLHSQRNLGTRASLSDDDLRLFRLAQSDISSPAIRNAMVDPINPSALHHVVSSGQAGCLCDLSITRISNIINAQQSPDQRRYHCMDGTFFSQLCRVRSKHITFNYPAVAARFEDWLEDRHPLNRSIICIPTNASGSHWNGIFILVDQRTILHVDSIRLDSHRSGSKVIMAVQYWLAQEIRSLLARPYSSTDFHARLLALQDPAAWTYTCRDVPAQSNNYDCGVFYIMNLVYLLQSRMPSFTQHDIPFLRRQLFAALIHNSIPPLSSPLSSHDTPFHIPPNTLRPMSTLQYIRYNTIRSPLSTAPGSSLPSTPLSRSPAPPISHPPPSPISPIALTTPLPYIDDTLKYPP